MKSRAAKLRSGSLLVAAFSLLSLRPAHAEISGITLGIKGLACPFCVHGIKKKIGEVDGVKGVEVSLKDGLVSVSPAPDNPPSSEALRDAITESGFTPGDITITAVGVLVDDNGDIALRVRGSDQTYLLFESRSEPHATLTGKMRTRLTQLAANSTLVTVTGVVHEHDELAPGLSINEVKPVAQ